MDVVWTIWLIYFLAALAASAVAISIGWRGQPAPDDANGRFDHLRDMSRPPAPQSDISDAAEAIRATTERMVPAIRRQRVHLDVAAEPGQFVRMRPGLLSDLIEELVSLGLHAAAGGHLLLTAGRSGGRVEIMLSDDQPACGISLRQSQARGLAQRLALYGGALDVVARPDLGTSMTMKLIAAADQPAVAESLEMADQNA